MKYITLNDDKTLAHVWLEGVHIIPNDAIQVSDSVLNELLEDQRGKAYINGNVINHTAPPPAINLRRDLAKIRIDTAAGAARQRFVSTGSLIDMEYKLAQEQTAAWRAAGSPAEDVPAAIRDWGTAAGMTDEQAAADLEATAAAWDQVLITVRKIRLEGKAAVDAATDQGTADDMANAAQPYIDQLDALTP